MQLGRSSASAGKPQDNLQQRICIEQLPTRPAPIWPSHPIVSPPFSTQSQDMHDALPPHMRPPAGHFVSAGGVQQSEPSFSFSQGGGADPVPVQAAQQLQYMQGTPLQPMYSPLSLLRGACGQA